MERASDAAIAAVSASTRPASLAEVFSRHYLQLVRLAWLMLDSREAAEDVVQDAFLKCQRRWDRVDDPAKIVAYVRAAVLNGARSRLRRRKTRRAARADPSIPMVVPDPVGAIVDREDSRIVMSAIRALPARQREVVLLRYFEDLSIPEMANTLGISSGAVKGSLFRAMGSLRTTLEGLTR
jgi:RNA polymerase sigma-70 factor (sigma-E family)